MSTKEPTGQESAGTTAETPRIDGPIAETDRYDELTGASYYRCTGCGGEAMRRSDVTEACSCGHGGGA